MKVKDVLEILQWEDPEAEVMVSSDEEGNSYRPANLSVGERFCNQDGEYVVVCEEDLEAGEFEGWEDNLFEAVVVW